MRGFEATRAKTGLYVSAVANTRYPVQVLADDLDIPRNRYAAHVVRGIAALNLLIGQPGRVPTLGCRLERFGRRVTTRSVERGLEGNKATHYTPLG
ncbi:hypothetical protein MSTO_48850 [Mycobacterium stomatepiae]|uniref:Uncharacterized protein n=2 Tax=Mycobacterium stomatepiae TaxID=470076 RepID=A0A7I7QEN0_9MYCO|nr:hypothetical protein MSTO_48850 [Mycobacterium stomatepiae]